MPDNDLDFEFPEDEWDYYLKLLDDIHRTEHLILTTDSIQEQKRLVAHLRNLQEWAEEVVPTNAWNNDCSIFW